MATHIPEEDIPPQDIHPDDKPAMTDAGSRIGDNFYPCPPDDFAIACQYVGDFLRHVGVVYKGRVWHTGSKCGTQVVPIDKFEGKRKEKGLIKTTYVMHKSLWLPW